MNESERVAEAATRIADAIGRRDVETLSSLLAPGFLLRSPGEDGRDAASFLDGVRQIPGEILYVRLLSLTVDVLEDGAIATGVQHAQVRVDDKDIDDRRPFVDWFVRHEGTWLLRLAVDLPAAQG